MEKLDFHRCIATRGKVDYMGTDTGMVDVMVEKRDNSGNLRNEEV